MRKFAVALLAGFVSLGWASQPAPIREVEIVGNDFAFVAPAELPPGPVVFRFRNSGKVRHEFNMALLKKGVSVDEFMSVLWSPDKSVVPLLEGPVGVLFAKRGIESSAGLVTNLQPGRDYVIICIFRDSANAKRHHQMGMYTRIHVTDGRTATPLPLPTDTIDGLDYAFRYKVSLRPGSHTFMFANKGLQRHEVAFSLLKPGITVDSLVKADKAGVNVNSLLEESPGLLHAQAGTSSLGFITLNLLPGREYLIECEFQDSAKAPPHYELGMFGSIKVTKQ